VTKIARLLLVLMLSLSIVAVAQTGATDKKTAQAEKKEAKAAEKGKAISLTGWVKTEGDKTVFVNDKDKQTWNVQNADVLKPHDGKHVKVKATLNESDKSMTIDDVKELRKSKQSGETKASPTS
jgi:uncharacterized lipoprotein NlpE involved in copper resistance